MQSLSFCRGWGKHKSTSCFRPHALNGKPFLHGRVANLAYTCVAKGNLAASTCGCSCKLSFPVGTHQKAFCEVGYRARRWEWSSFWCPIGMVGGWEGTCFFPCQPICEHDFGGASLKGVLLRQRKAATASLLSCFLICGRQVWSGAPQGAHYCSASPLSWLRCQACCKHFLGPSPTWTAASRCSQGRAGFHTPDWGSAHLQFLARRSGLLSLIGCPKPPVS